MIKNGMAVLKFALIAALVQVAAPAHADDYLSPTDERVRLSLGIEHLSNTTNMQLDSSTGLPGTAINAESVLGLDSSDFEPKFQAMIRVGERNRLRFDYFSLDRTGQVTLAGTPIVFKDSVLQVGDPVETTLSLRTLGITYEYSFIHREKFELAATFGINDTDLSARARVATETRHVNETEDQAGPFPTFGLDSTYVLSKRFYLDGRAQYFKLAVDHLTGSVGFYEFAALYRYRPNISFALGYTASRADIESRQPKTSGYFDLDSKGPEAFFRVAF
ncbi:MAG: hypothetical protein WA803_11930 [Steroidobacteraceae bacterium]